MACVMRAICFHVLAFAAAMVLAQPAQAAKRVALVIGIDAYEQVPKLEKAVNDARAVGEALEATGFTVLTARNVARRDLNRMLLEFSARLDPGDEAVFYFAGHGVEIEGRNYLLAADVPTARPGHEAFITSEGVAVDRVLDMMRGRGARVSLLILDACRDNPFQRDGTRSLGGTRGLGATAAPEGAFILYSAGIGQLALDRLDDDDPNPNSVFTRKLVPLMREPGLPLVEAARRLRRQVQDLARTVAHDQRPAYYDEVTGQFFFTPGERAVVVESAPPAQPAPAPAPVPSSPAAQAWAAVQNSDSEAVLEAFVTRFPDTVYAEFAKARLAELRAKAENARREEARRLAALKRQQEEQEARQGRPAGGPGDAAALGQQAQAAYQAKNYSESFRLARQAAELGDAVGMFRLAWAYASGEGVAKDEREAVRWYRQAADKGHANATHNLGWMYANGRGVAKNEGEAVRWYRQAADEGHARAMLNLGVMYSRGEGVAKDEAEAARWYRAAADKGIAQAMFNLGAMHSDGRGVAKSDAEALHWFRQAADKGHADAMTIVGWQYSTGRGVAKDEREAVRWYRRAADKDQAGGWYGLGFMYANGYGVTKDDREAASYVLSALKGGHGFARQEMTTNAAAWGVEFRRELQRLMREEGVYSGAIDGQFGPATVRAIEALAKE